MFCHVVIFLETCLPCSLNERAAIQAHMRPLALSVASGSISSLLVAVARDLARSDFIPPAEVCPLLTEEPRCLGLDITSVLVGILIGLLLGPILDGLYLVRHGLLRSAASSITWISARPHYRVLNESTRG